MEGPQEAVESEKDISTRNVCFPVHIQTSTVVVSSHLANFRFAKVLLNSYVLYLKDHSWLVLDV